MEIMKKVTNSVLSDLTRPYYEKAISILKQKMLYQLDITYNSTYIDEGVLRKIFPNIPWRQDHDYHRTRWYYPEINGTYVDFAKYHGTIISLTVESTSSNPDNNHYVYHTVWLSCVKTKQDIKHLHQFVAFLHEKSEEFWSNQPNSFAYLYSFRQGFGQTVRRPIRSWNDVFIDRDIQYKLINALNEFVNHREWYDKHKIPYHFGILLHGNPGTGKSSIVQVLTNMYPSDVVYIKASDVVYGFDSNNLRFFERFTPIKRPVFVVVEDIDTGQFSENRNIQKKTSYRNNSGDDAFINMTGKEILGQVLNFMDGFASPKNVIYIFTTNHIESLDPALIRPGRIDLTVEIGYVTDEPMSRFLMSHYGKPLPLDRHMKDGITFAQLQTMVMTKMSFDDIVKEVTT